MKVFEFVTFTLRPQIDFMGVENVFCGSLILFFFYICNAFILFIHIFLNLFIFNWRIIALQYYVGFCHTSTWISHRYTSKQLISWAWTLGFLLWQWEVQTTSKVTKFTAAGWVCRCYTEEYEPWKDFALMGTWEHQLEMQKVQTEQKEDATSSPTP